MKQINQTDGLGNCLQATVASLLELSLDEVPNFALYNEQWYESLRLWMLTQNKHIMRKKVPSLYRNIVVGPSSRGVDHATAMDKGVKWDPHPSREGVLSTRYYITINDA